MGFGYGAPDHGCGTGLERSPSRARSGAQKGTHDDQRSQEDDLNVQAKKKGTNEQRPLDVTERSHTKEILRDNDRALGK